MSMWLRCTRSFYETIGCDPIFTPIGMAIGATAETAAATGMAATAAAAAVAGTALSAAGSYQQGQQAKQVANYNAETARNNAIGTEMAAGAEANRKDVESRRLLAAGRAAAGASGVDPNSGSPLDVAADIAGQAKLDEELARWQARERAKGYTNQATLDTYSGRQAARAGLVNAGSTVLQGLGRGIGSFGSSLSTRPVSPGPRS